MHKVASSWVERWKLIPIEGLSVQHITAGLELMADLFELLLMGRQPHLKTLCVDTQPSEGKLTGGLGCKATWPLTGPSGAAQSWINV